MEREQTLEVVLVEGHRHADEHRDHAKTGDKVAHRGFTDILEQIIGQADDTVDAALGQNAGNHQRDGSGRHGVGIRRQGLEREQERLGGKADKEERKGRHHGGVHVRGSQLGDLRHVQRVQVGVDENRADQQARRTDGADNEVLECTLECAVIVIAERGQRHGGEGHNLHHDIDVEQIAGQHKAQHRAGQHEEQRVEVDLAVIPCHISKAVNARDHHGNRDNQAEEQAQRIHLKADAVGPARIGRPAAHPVADGASLKEYGTNQGKHHAQCKSHCDKHNGVAHFAAAPAQQAVQKCPHEQGHDGKNR